MYKNSVLKIYSVGYLWFYVTDWTSCVGMVRAHNFRAIFDCT